MTLINGFKRLHKWLALIIFIQLLLWIISGLVFSFIDHNAVKGNTLIDRNSKNVWVQAPELHKVRLNYPKATKIIQKKLLGQTIFQVKVNGTTLLVDEVSKKEIKVSKQQIIQIATEHYRGNGVIKKAKLMTESDNESRKLEMPSWQVVFSDKSNSHLYFSAVTGDFQAIRTDSWRLFDFFLMLHFMDYAERGNFNHPLIIFFSIVLLFLSISGTLLVVKHFSKQDFLWLVSLVFPSKQVNIEVTDSKGKVRNIKTKSNHRLIDILASENIILSSTCAGGGLCGKCKIKIQVDNEHELNQYTQKNTKRQLVSGEEINQGYRLACQVYTGKDMNLEIAQSFK